MSLGPAVAVLAGFVVLGQRLSPLELLAVALVIVASAGAVRTPRAGRRPEPHHTAPRHGSAEPAR